MRACCYNGKNSSFCYVRTLILIEGELEIRYTYVYDGSLILSLCMGSISAGWLPAYSDGEKNIRTLDSEHHENYFGETFHLMILIRVRFKFFSTGKKPD